MERSAGRPPLKYTQQQLDAAVKLAVERERAAHGTVLAKAREEGRREEAAARDDGLSADAREVRSLLEHEARRYARIGKRDLAAYLYRVYAAGDSVWKRLGMALGGRWR